MRWSFHIARIAGIDVKIHVTFFLLLAFYGLNFYGQGGPPGSHTGSDSHRADFFLRAPA
jgi:stage IV sporulation protein FB